jgi:hypothetical protein
MEGGMEKEGWEEPLLSAITMRSLGVRREIERGGDRSEEEVKARQS